MYKEVYLYLQEITSHEKIKSDFENNIRKSILKYWYKIRDDTKEYQLFIIDFKLNAAT